MFIKRDRVKKTEVAEKYIKAGKFREAIRVYKEILSTEPEDINLINIIGDLYVRLGEKKSAQEEFQKIAAHYEEKGLYAQAIAIYKKIIKLNPEDKETVVKLADLLRSYGHTEEARKEYLRIAEELKKAGRQDEAIPLFEKLVRLESSDISSRLTLGEMYQEAGRIDDALVQLNAVAELRIREGKLKEAEEVLIRANGLKENDERTVSNLFNLFLKKERKKEAFALLNSALKKDKKNPRFLHLLGTLYFEDGNLEKAKEVFNQIKELKSLGPETRVKLGRIYIQEGNLETAYELFEPVVEALLARDRVEKAVGLLGLILSSKKIHLPTLEKLVSIYESSGQNEKLETAYRVILEEYRERGLKEKAFSILHNLLRICPGDEELLDLHRRLEKELRPEEKEKEISSLTDEDREAMRMKLSKVELCLEEGNLRDARRILDELKADYGEEEKIDEKIALLDEIRTRVEKGEVEERAERIEEEKPREKKPGRGEEEKVSVAEIFGETDIMPEIVSEVSESRYYDLAQVVSGELKVIEEIVQHQLRGKTETFEHELSEIISKFRKEIEEKIDRKDAEAHYNLGVAFLEQGLIDEALVEFEVASREGSRAVDCYSIISQCYKQKKDYQEAVKWAEKGLGLTEKGSAQHLSLCYDLAVLYEEMKKKKKALELYEEIGKISPDYRAVSERIKKLKKSSTRKSS